MKTVIESASNLGSNFQDSTVELIEVVAQASIDAMTQIAAVASEKGGERSVGLDLVMGSVNSWTDAGAGKNLAEAQNEQARAAHELALEPMIARVRTRDDSGVEKVYHFTRNFTLTVKGLALTSYNSGAPVGRLAALDVGDDFELPDGRFIEVIEKGTFKPVFTGDGWDGIESKLQSGDFAPLAVESLRRLLDHGLKPTADKSDPFALFDDEPVLGTTIARKALSGLGLRDQSVMNKVQDEIFRLPIDRQIMLEGPPGTGKTTTLIKRLSQKRIVTKEREEDFRVIDGNPLAGDHGSSWIMFSPTELLEHYLREAFARDNVPASQERIKTWANFRNVFATQVLGLLRTGKTGRGFVRDDALVVLTDEALQNQPSLYDAFYQAQFTQFRSEVEASVSMLRESGDELLREIALDLSRRLDSGAASTLLATHLAVEVTRSDLTAWITATRRSINKTVDRRINVIGRRRSSELEDLRRLIKRIDTDQFDEEDEELDEDEAPPTAGRQQMFRVMRAAIRAMAMARLSGRAVSRTSKYRLVADWIGMNAIPEEELDRIGMQHRLIAAASRVSLSTRDYFTRLPQRYRAFRQEAPQPWYLAKAADETKLSPTEVDLLVAIHLDAASALLASEPIRAGISQSNLRVLEPLIGEFRNQILVDEATDFSPLQLRAMFSLATPGVKSFFACGDFNQRLTRDGVAEEEQMGWAVPGLEFRKVEIAYRQSEELRSFARRLIELSGGVLLETELNGPRETEGYQPVFNSSEVGNFSESRWVAERIEEIERLHDKFPSVAVFVPDEDKVEIVATELRAALAETNIDVEACVKGQVLGQAGRVRVFAVEHIKGLEFEAAFFHSLQDLCRDAPELLDKFLYVGATRAATFLGLSCTGEPPWALAAAVEGLGSSWDL
ncbi:hypothetical protein K3553_14265 [Leisingera aquaemixtae]|uniref:hypothetical protein n=1 Tax=Leisingera aquaemixtae TaxID=1396826 RepID=UPI0021A4FCB2|nr:hypothetical protein [Leisingera aquaemixtae]UWQ24113.1 hypothetical protein K3553_14265 [Leisingera aquaemixtae]UWQ45016.1 hypothetical protein K3719_14720 [Leisingera aquaemixtae]